MIVGVPYHVTQRGNRRQQVFFCDEDRRRYLSWLYDYSERYRLELLSYCLMTNHIHLVVIPHDPLAGMVVEDWAEALGNPEDEEVVETLRSRTQCGFPCGDEEFIARLSEMLRRPLVLRPPRSPEVQVGRARFTGLFRC